MLGWVVGALTRDQVGRGRLHDGTEVEFRNSDSANHCVMSLAFKSENTFNVVTPPGNSYTHKFVADNRRAIKIGCPIHVGMGAWIKVYDHPYHTVTNAAGRYKLPPVPAGKYKLHVLHADGQMKTVKEVEVPEGRPLKVEIPFTKDDLKVK